MASALVASAAGQTSLPPKSTDPSSAASLPASELTRVDVLGCWFGRERGRLLSDPKYVGAWIPVWFGGQRAAQQLEAFEPLILRAGEGSLAGAGWNTDEGLLAQIILLDQMPRELWRRTPDAFRFDARARRLAERLLVNGLGCWETAEAMFVVLPLTHSEAPADHDRLRAVLAADAAERRERGLPPHMEQDAAMAESHRVVVERFGRYPHRNALLGRVSTPEEERWLAEDTPGWATSQRPLGEGSEAAPPPLAGPADSRRAVRLIALDCTSALSERSAPTGDVLPFFQWALRLGYVVARVWSSAESRRDHGAPAAGLGPMVHFEVFGEAGAAGEPADPLDSLLARGRALLPDLEPRQILHVGGRRREAAEAAAAHGLRAASVERPRSAGRPRGGGEQAPRGVVVVASFEEVRLRLESAGGEWAEG